MTLVSNFEARAPALWAGGTGTRNVTIGLESPADFWARERLLDTAFGVARFEKTVERLREGRLPAEGLAFAAKDARGLIGTLRLWHIRAGGTPALLLGPLAVAKACRSQGIGHAAVLLVGDASYYEPFGFSRRHTLGLSLPGPVDAQRFLGLELTPGALKGVRGIVTAAGVREFPARRSEIAVRRAA
jgi:predicted N-acetyltransferase YhbS